MPAELRLKVGSLDWVQTSEEMVILDGRAEAYFTTNPTGTLLWSALQEGTTREELIDLLRETFDIDRTRAESDVEAYLAQLNDLNMLD